MAETLTTVRPPQMDEVAELEPTDLFMVQRGDGPVQTAPAQAMMTFIEDQGVGAVAAATAVAARDVALGAKTGAEAAADLAQDAAGRFNPFKGPVAGTDAEVIADMLLIGPDGAALYAGAYYVKYCARVGANFYLNICKISDDAVITAVGANGTPTDVTGFTGMTKVPLVECFGLGITGWALVDFKAGGNFGALVPIDTAASRLDNDKVVFASPERASTIERIAKPASTQAVARTGVFLPTAADYLRDYIVEAWIYMAERRRVGISLLETSTNRVRVHLKDWDSGEVIAQGGPNMGADPIDYETLREIRLYTGPLDGGNQEQFTGVEVVLKVDPSKVVIAGAPSATEYASYAAGGFLPARVVPLSVQELVLEAPAIIERRMVGAGAHADFLTAAGTLHEFPEVGVDPNENFPGNVRCVATHNQHLVALTPVERDAAFTFDERVVLGNWMCVDLRGGVITAPDGDRAFESNFSGVQMHGTIRQHPSTDANTAYAEHVDPVNGRTRPAEIGEAIQQQRIQKAFIDWHYDLGEHQNSWGRGTGFPSGYRELNKDCSGIRRRRESGQAMFGYHNSPGSTEPAHVWHIGTRCDQLGGAAVQVLTQAVQEGGRNRFYFRDCDPFFIQHACSMPIAIEGVPWAGMPDLAADRRMTDFVGHHEGPASYEDEAALVLSLPIGAVVSGTAVPVLFGQIDPYGYGEKLVLEGSIRSMGRRLAASGTVTLTVNGVTHSFAGAGAGSSVASLIAAANATLGAGVLALARADRRDFPDIGWKRRVWSVDDSTIPAGRMVKLVATNDVALAGPGDQVFGWTLTPIIAGVGGVVVTQKVIPRYYLPEANANGKFGIGPTGLIDYAAAEKVGCVEGAEGDTSGFIRWWR